MELVVNDVNCGYHKTMTVMRHVSFSVSDGDVCCLLGPNGCGKTTLFKTLLGILPPLSGKILLDGEDVSKWPASKFASIFAYVSQDHAPPFPYLVKDVVMLGRANSLGYMGRPSAKDEQIVNDAMRSMGVYDMKDRYYTDLSGGELQLVMIARAIAQEPRILVLDEPTAALDYGNSLRVVGKIKELSEAGYAVIMTTHAPDHAFMCKGTAVLLSRSQPVVFGKAEDVVTERNLYSIYGVDVKIVSFTNSRHELTHLCTPVV